MFTLHNFWMNDRCNNLLQFFSFLHIRWLKFTVQHFTKFCPMKMRLQCKLAICDIYRKRYNIKKYWIFILDNHNKTLWKMKRYEFNQVKSAYIEPLNTSKEIRYLVYLMKIEIILKESSWMLLHHSKNFEWSIHMFWCMIAWLVPFFLVLLPNPHVYLTMLGSN